MATTLFSTLTEKDKSDAIKRLIDESTPRDEFFLMTVLSVLMAAFGLLIDSSAVIIGSMLIAPLLSPILGVSLGVVMADSKLMMRSLITIGKALLWSIPAAAVVTLLFATQVDLGTAMNGEILARTEVSIVYIAIAVIAGFAASFALIKPQLSATLPGVAISVAIIPPLAVTGIGIANFNWNMITSSFILFLINAISIVFASMIVFSFMNLYVKRAVADKAIEEEDKELEADKKKAEKAAEIRKKQTDILEKVDKALEKAEEE